MTSADESESRGSRLGRASVWMAFGTIVSRITGMLRAILLVGVLGYSLNADMFSFANSIPNSLYILVAGGIFNVVLVPQLVRSMKHDADGGEAFANRIITGALLVLGVATVVLMLAVPLIMRLLYREPAFYTSDFDTQRQAAYWLMVLCMPQVFFYGMFVLVGQLLNSRERFGPMMWAPIVNNIIAIATLGAYALIFGASNAGDGFTAGEILLLGLGSTAGIMVQALTLVPFLKGIGFTFRPRFDFRGTGLGQTARLSLWTLGFIVVNQVAYFYVARLALSATTEGKRLGEPAAGQTIYELGFLISQVPHGVITVSLATAIIPTLAALAADGRLDMLGIQLSRTIRMALVLIVPIAVLVGLLSQPLAVVLVGWGSASDPYPLGTTFAAFAVTMVTFTAHYLVLRGFYAMNDTRTPFFIQVFITAVNMVAATVLSTAAPLIYRSTMLALAFGIAYALGMLVSVTILSRRIGNILDREMLTFLVKITLSAVSAVVVVLAVTFGWDQLGWNRDSIVAAFSYLAVSSLVASLVFLLVAHMVKIKELNYITSKLLRRS